jgi:hypothetical protein
MIQTATSSNLEQEQQHFRENGWAMFDIAKLFDQRRWLDAQENFRNELFNNPYYIEDHQEGNKNLEVVAIRTYGFVSYDSSLYAPAVKMFDLIEPTIRQAVKIFSPETFDCLQMFGNKYAAGRLFGRHKDSYQTDKFQISAVLHMPSEYSGGEFRIYPPGVQQGIAPGFNEGKIVIFPSNLSHEVTTIESGERGTISLFYGFS